MYNAAELRCTSLRFPDLLQEEWALTYRLWENLGRMAKEGRILAKVWQVARFVAKLANANVLGALLSEGYLLVDVGEEVEVICELIST